MPFPWKKAKNSRISQLVNDHVQNSKKRPGGSSLIVETGFRTSLVDFAIKNGEKLKKTSKKNRAKPPKIPSGNVENNDPMILQSSSILPSNSFTPSSSCCSSPCCSPLPPESRNFDEVSNESGVGRRLVVAVVKIILVVVLALALGTKKFVVGITISAFLLIFLEYVGKYKYGCRMLRPCSDADAEQGLILNVQRVFSFKEDNNKNCFDPGCSDSDKCESMRSSRVIEPEIPSEKEIMDEQICKEKLGYEEETDLDEEESVSQGQVLELKRRMSRKDKIKSKMKKLVPKKLRSSKKEECSKIYSITCEEDESEDEKNQKL